MLKKLKLTNFKKHKELEVDFTDGLNVVLGPNFCGKSTLMKAIAVVRYGIKAAGKKSKIATSGESKWKVELTETINGEDHVITRTGSTARVTNSNDEVVADGNSVVTQWVTDNCGADLEDFTTHTYSKQMETSTLLTLGAAKMQGKVEKLANVDIVDKVIKLLSTKNSEVKGKLDLLAEVDLQEIQDEFDPLDTRLTEACDAVKLQESAIQIAEEKLMVDTEAYQVELGIQQVVEDSETLVIGTKANIELTEHLVEDSTIKLAAVPDVSKKLKQVSEKTKLVGDSLVRDQASAHEKNSLLTKTASLEMWIKITGSPNLKEELRLDPLIAELEISVAEATGKVTKAKENVILQQAKIQTILTAEGESECPTCHRKYEDHDEVDYAQELTDAQATLSTMNGVHLTATRNYDVLADELEALISDYPGEGHAKLITDTRGKIDLNCTLLDGYVDVPTLERIEEMKHEIEPLKDELESLLITDRIRNELKLSIENLTKSLDLAKTELTGQEKTLRNLPKSTMDLEAERDKIETLENNLRTYRAHSVDLTNNLNTARQQHGIVQYKLEQAKKTEEQVKSFNKLLGKYSKLTKYLRASRSRFLGTIWQSILSRATEIVSNATAGDDDQITEIARSDKGEFTYFERNIEYGINDASGCQMEMMGVSIRLALCDLFYGHGSYMMLDEASSQMNEENAAALAGVLAATGKQIIYITHRPTEETTAKNIIKLGEAA